jgi:hypothetical protein
VEVVSRQARARLPQPPDTRARAPSSTTVLPSVEEVAL